MNEHEISVMGDGTKISWRLDGPEQSPRLVLLNSIGTNMELWDGVMELLPGFRILRIDTRGHGNSDAPTGDYSLAQLAGDVATVMDEAGFIEAAVVGLSLGGMIALQLALTVPGRVKALLLICTSAQMDAPSWAARVCKVREGGLEAIADLATRRFFSPAFLAASHAPMEATRASLLAMSRNGYAGCAAAIRDMKLLPRLGELSLPVLIVVGDEDSSTPYQGHGALLEQGICGAVVARLPGGHLASVEQPARLAAAIMAFLVDERASA